MKKETLGSWRSRIQVADLAFDSSGDVLVVASDGYISSSIQSYRVTLSYSDSQCKIACNATASLYAKCHQDKAMDDSPFSRITHIRYMHDDLLQVIKKSKNSELQHSANLLRRIDQRDLYKCCGESIINKDSKRFIKSEDIASCQDSNLV